MIRFSVVFKNLLLILAGMGRACSLQCLHKPEFQQTLVAGLYIYIMILIFDNIVVQAFTKSIIVKYK
jgi:hypothetical protein